MTQLEWDVIMAEETANILNESRQQPLEIMFAAAVLTRVTGESVFAHFVAEYGDGEGIRQMDEFVTIGTTLLQKGETLTRVVLALAQVKRQGNKVEIVKELDPDTKGMSIN